MVFFDRTCGYDFFSAVTLPLNCIYSSIFLLFPRRLIVAFLYSSVLWVVLSHLGFISHQLHLGEYCTPLEGHGLTTTTTWTLVLVMASSALLSVRLFLGFLVFSPPLLYLLHSTLKHAILLGPSTTLLFDGVSYFCERGVGEELTLKMLWYAISLMCC